MRRSQALEAFGAWRALLGELGALGERLCGAIEANDVVTSIATMMDMRRVRAAVARVEAPDTTTFDDDEHAAMREVSQLTLAARMAELAMQQWIGRPLPPQADLLSTPLGVAVLADAILPAVWDFDADLVVLVGRGLEPVAQILSDIGQRRVIVYDCEPCADAIVVAKLDEIPMAVRSMVPIAPNNLVVHAMANVDRELAKRVTDAARGAISDLRVHRNTMHAFSRTWLQQTLANLPAIGRWPSVTALDDKLAGVPMVIVAPGPSLAKNSHQLAALKGRAIITCFSHSLKPVLAAGVVPDFVITVDPQDVRYHFAGCDLSQTTLVNGVTVHPALYELPARRFMTLAANGSVDDWMFERLGEQPLVPGGGSVATTALSLALRWRCDPIIFVGLDLSFANGQYYVSTSSDGAARAEVGANGEMQVQGWSAGFRAMKAAGGPTAPVERVVELPGWHGDTVRSSFMFSLFHRWFEELLARGAPVEIFNCTEGGARIAGMKHAPLATIAATLHHTYDVGGMVDAAYANVSPERGVRLARQMRDHRRGLRRARRLATRVIDMIERGSTGQGLEQVERALGSTLRPLAFVSLLAQREVERAQDVAHRHHTTRDYLAASSSLLQTLGVIIDELLPSIDSAIVRITPQEPSHAV